MTQDGDGAAEALAREEARLIKIRLLKLMTASLAAQDKEPASVEEARRRHILLRHYVDQLKAVAEIEGSLDTSGKSQGVGTIDLDAARHEIRERLLRIRADGQD